MLNRAFLEPGLGLRLPGRGRSDPAHDAPLHQDGDLERCEVDLDFLGVQYYTRLRARSGPSRAVDRPRIRRRPRPGKRPRWVGRSARRDSRTVLDMVHAHGRYPRIVVTEGGASFPDELIGNRVHDDRRIAYHETHLAQVKQARERGVPVDGYFCWSLDGQLRVGGWFRTAVRAGLRGLRASNASSKDSGHWFAEQLGGWPLPAEAGHARHASAYVRHRRSWWVR